MSCRLKLHPKSESPTDSAHNGYVDIYEYIDSNNEFVMFVGIEATEFDIDHYTIYTKNIDTEIGEQAYIRDRREPMRYPVDGRDFCDMQDYIIKIYGYTNYADTNKSGRNISHLIGEYRINTVKYGDDCTEHLLLSESDYKSIPHPLRLEDRLKNNEILYNTLIKINYMEFRDLIRVKVNDITSLKYHMSGKNKIMFTEQRANKPEAHVKSHIFSLDASSLNFTYDNHGYGYKFIDTNIISNLGTHITTKGYRIHPDNKVDNGFCQAISEDSYFNNVGFYEVLYLLGDEKDNFDGAYLGESTFEHLHLIVQTEESVVNFSLSVPSRLYEVASDYITVYIMVNRESPYLSTVDDFRSRLSELTDSLLIYNNDSRKRKIRYVEVGGTSLNTL